MMVKMVGNKNRMTMKNFKFIYALLAATLFVTACSDEELINEGRVPAADGSEIIFGGRAGFENNDPKGRTIYTGEVYTYDGKDFERIDWITGDKIEIYSPQASNGPSAHYNVTGFTTGDENAGETGKGSDYAYLERQGESSLQWNGDGDHTFYAMYPSTSMFVREDGTIPTVEQGIKLGKSGNNIVVNGTVPTSQSGTITESDGNYTIAPNMKYAYMVAKTTANRIENPNVGLSFVPIVTAVEFELKVPENTDEEVHDVLIAEIQVTGTGIAGDFTADLSSWTTGYPTCSNVGAGQGTIQISTYVDYKPIVIKEGKSLKFTVFMRPGVDPAGLKVSYSPNGTGYFGKSLQNVTIPRNLKTRVKNLYLPATYDEDDQLVIDASKWMSQLADNVVLKALSIPGSGGTFSYNYNSSDPEWYKQQTISFEEQWKLGIRAFEIVSDRPSSSNTTLGTQNVKCNKESMGVTVLEVLEDLLARVALKNDQGKATETAVLILTYQPEGVWGNARNASNYSASLKKMYDGLTSDQKSQIIQFTPTLTLGEARGKVMIFCRINQRDEDEDGNFSTASTNLSGTNITLIDGCGTGKDRWGSRGYKVGTSDENRVVAYDAAHTSDSKKSVDYYMNNSRTDDQYKNNVSRGDLNFGFSTNYSGITCWYQEWARVVDLAHLGVTSADYYKNGTRGARWYESYNEKVQAATKTFDMAVSGEYSSYIFINSLCGYLVDSKISSSYTQFTGSNTGGIAGNIKPLADKLNVDFYKYVLDSGFEQKSGPTGIVMMDYVSNVPTGAEFDGAYLLPGVILANNFKGNLDTNPDGSGSGSGSGPGSDEGEEEEG